VSWGLSIARDAIVDLQALDPWLQEEVLDEVDGLCAHPPRPRGGLVDAEFVHDFERTSAGVRHVVFIRVRRDETTSTLSVLSIVDVVRPPLSQP
jgi:hypothetical protein